MASAISCDFDQMDSKISSKYPQCCLSLHQTLGPRSFVTPPSRPMPLTAHLSTLSSKSKLKFMPIFKLGNNAFTGDVLQAAEALLKREYPDLHRASQEGPTFIPGFFIPKNPVLIDKLSPGQNISSR